MPLPINRDTPVVAAYFLLVAFTHGQHDDCLVLAVSGDSERTPRVREQPNQSDGFCLGQISNLVTAFSTASSTPSVAPDCPVVDSWTESSTATAPSPHKHQVDCLATLLDTNRCLGESRKVPATSDQTINCLVSELSGSSGNKNGHVFSCSYEF